MEQQHESEYVGTPGERRRFTLTTKAFHFLDTDYDICTLITYHDNEGNVVKWFRSGQHEMELGQVGDYEATVKQHVEYGDAKETHIVRAKPYVSPEDKKRLTKERREAKKEYDRLQKLTDEAWATIGDAEGNSAAYHEAKRAATEAYNAWKSL